MEPQSHSQLTFAEYQEFAATTAIYPARYQILYPALGLASEAGEVLGKIKKVLRDQDGIFSDESKDAIGKELADCWWYLAALYSDLQLDMEHYVEGNISKLMDRKARGVLGGSGDNR